MSGFHPTRNFGHFWAALSKMSCRLRRHTMSIVKKTLVSSYRNQQDFVGRRRFQKNTAHGGFGGLGGSGVQGVQVFTCHDISEDQKGDQGGVKTGNLQNFLIFFVRFSSGVVVLPPSSGAVFPLDGAVPQKKHWPEGHRRESTTAPRKVAPPNRREG